MIQALEVTGLSVSRGERRLFGDLSFRLQPGEALALTGANGSGKTSLLRAIAGLLRPDAGRIDFDGVEPEVARARGLHWLGHLDGLRSNRTARKELSFQAEWTGADAGGISRAIDALALGGLMALAVRQLSAGQRRRLALGRLIAAPRPLWLLDEPMAPLDTYWRSRLGEMMAAHLREGGMAVIAVHDPLPIPARTLNVGAGR